MEITNRFDILNNELLSITAALYSDVDRIETQLNIEDNQTWRRLYVKSVCSAIEAKLSFLENHIKLTREIDYVPLSDEEEIILYGKQGTIKKVKRLSFIERTALLINLFLDANHSLESLVKNSEDWKNFTRLISIRNRVTHPRTFTNIEITAEEIQNCRKAFRYFQDLLIKTMNNASNSLLRTSENLKKALDKIEIE